MKFCSNCGHLLEDSANFCSNCGKAVNSDPVYDYEPEDLDVGYRVVLISRGSCSVSNAKELLSDLLGYSSSTAKDLLDEAPVEIADELTEKQAVVLAQALAEYGMEITIVDENNTFVDFSSKATSSVFD
ncbi:MAG: zinc-ribbon domain-containing protein, partial [Erysipelotrichaceae bacterium]|nr:zinc-ribbon domain-containing protein [Erysipelotrichaceae bacterium]